MQVVKFLLAFVALTATLSSTSAQQFSVTAHADAGDIVFDRTCEVIVRQNPSKLSTHRYGPLDVTAIQQFCELFEKSASKFVVAEASAESCVDTAAFNDKVLAATDDYDIADHQLGRVVSNYAGDGADGTTKLLASLEKGNDKLNNALNGAVSNADGSAFQGGALTLFSGVGGCQDAIGLAQNGLITSLRSSGIVVSKTAIEAALKSIREQFAARAGRLYVQRHADAASEKLNEFVLATPKCAAAGKAASEKAAKVVEATANQLATIREWESGKENPSGSRPSTLTDSLTKSIQELKAEVDGVSECAEKHKVALAKQAYKVAMFDDALASSDAIVKKYEVGREKATQELIIDGYNSYQKLQ